MSKYHVRDFLLLELTYSFFCQAVKSNFGLNVRKVKQRASAACIKT